MRGIWGCKGVQSEVRLKGEDLLTTHQTTQLNSGMSCGDFYQHDRS
jgi:hypothetical protein